MDSREYNQLDALSSSSNVEISRLSVIIKDLKERVESLESNQTDLMDKINAFEREKTGQQDQKAAAAEVMGSNPAQSISFILVNYVITKTPFFNSPRILICPLLPLYHCCIISNDSIILSTIGKYVR